MKVLFYTNIPSPYRVDFFNELGKYCELTVLFETDSSTERNADWKQFKFQNFKGIILKGMRTRVDAAFCPEIIKYLKKDKYDHIVVTQLASLTAIWAVAYMRLSGIRYCYEGDGGFVTNVTGIKAALKKFVIGNAEFCLSTAKSFDEYCLAYGAEQDRIYRYPFSSVCRKDALEKVLTKDEKDFCKSSLSIKDEYVILSVGQFIYRKGFDLLLEVSRMLPQNIGIYIIGGKPTVEYLEKKEKWNLQNVHFVDFMKKDKLAQYYQAADLFVFPTREDIWGLVVNEAMAYGLPVISTDRCVAAVEMVVQGENGYIVPVDNTSLIEKYIEIILEEGQTRQHMSEIALKTLKEQYTIEEMVRTHLEVFQKEKR